MFDTIVLLTFGLPLLAAAANGINLVAGETLWGWRGVQNLTLWALGGAFLAAIWVFAQIVIDPTPREVILFRWFQAAELNIDVGFLIDALSAIMMLVVTGFSFLIAKFSVNYMHNDYSFSRYFSALSLFVFAMLILVMSNNFVMLFLGWESVGLCSYLLIGHYYDRKSAARAGTKAFVMNRVGDAGFLMGIFLIATNFGTVAYSEVFARLGMIDTATATAIGLCLLTGAIGKSAQLPLGTWLAKAMEGPTPSSALIHAATMVTAGVYMITRAHPIYDMAPIAMAAVTIVGALTAVYGATVGKTISDIKGILAASTSTQLGLMFVACGLGAYPIAIFHLVTHAFLKTFLFLTAPSILHYFHTFPDAGAVEKHPAPVPVVFWLILVGCIGLIAYPFGAGLLGAGQATGLAASGYVLAAAGIMAAFTTIYYAASATNRIFGHDDHADHAHGAPEPSRLGVPILALLVLAGVGLVLGLLPGGMTGTWFGTFLAPVVSLTPTAGSGTLMSFGVVAAIGLVMMISWAAALMMDRFNPELPGTAMLRARGLYAAAMKRFWLDDFYHRVIVAGAVQLGRMLGRFDNEVIDRMVGAPAPAGRIRSANTTWEQRFIAARSAGIAGILGSAATSAGAPETKPRRGGLLPWLTEASARSSGQVETHVIAAGSGVVGALTATASRSSALFEKDIIAQGQGLIGIATDGAAVISGWVERNVFEVGINSGVSQTGGVLGATLYRIEEMLGKPIVVGILVSLAVFGLFWGIIS
jgi:NADH-quinone oxidoreductase subunit L